jgi:hypothetical protein
MISELIGDFLTKAFIAALAVAFVTFMLGLGVGYMIWGG